MERICLEDQFGLIGLNRYNIVILTMIKFQGFERET